MRYGQEVTVLMIDELGGKIMKNLLILEQRHIHT